MTSEISHSRSGMTAARTAELRSGLFSAAEIISMALLLGLILRVSLFMLGPRYSFFADHDDYVRYAILAVDDGVTSIYLEKTPRWPRLAFQKDGLTYQTERRRRVVFNYPPVAAYAHWLEGQVHRLVDDQRVSNTLTARAVFGALSLLGDVLCACGCFAIVNLFAGRRASALAFTLTFLAPPLAIDSAFWTQTDSWIMAPMVWMVYAMMRQRWWCAGLLWGLGLGLKPQALFFAAVWLYAVIVHREKRRILLAAVLGVVLLNVLALPFWLTSGTTWVEKSYLENLGQIHPKTSLTAFNIWYADQLLCENRDSSVKMLGITKDWWGKIFLAVGVSLSYWIAWRARRAGVSEWPLVTALVLLSVMMLSTRVHERYLVIALPFLFVSSFRLRRLWPGCLLLIAVATAQIMAHNWGEHLAGKRTRSRVFRNYAAILHETPPEMREQMRGESEDYAKYLELRAKDWAWEWLLVIASLAGYGYVIVASVTYRAHAGLDLPPPMSSRPD